MNEGDGKHDNPTVDEGGEFDPRAAATLLEQTTRRAQRQFAFPSPLLSLIQAAALLAAYGAIWLSVRGQNPYSGPSGTALVELYTFVAVAAIAVGLDGGAQGPGSPGAHRDRDGYRPSLSRRPFSLCTSSWARSGLTDSALRSSTASFRPWGR
jgi:hypothetical protein